jgi:hypothetical protein
MRQAHDTILGRQLAGSAAAHASQRGALVPRLRPQLSFRVLFGWGLGGCSCRPGIPLSTLFDPTPASRNSLGGSGVNCGLNPLSQMGGPRAGSNLRGRFCFEPQSREGPATVSRPRRLSERHVASGSLTTLRQAEREHSIGDWLAFAVNRIGRRAGQPALMASGVHFTHPP